MNDHYHMKAESEDSSPARETHSGILTVLKALPKTQGDRPQKVFDDGSTQRDPSHIVRYTSIESVNERNITVAWDGYRHIFDRRTGRCIESELGLMSDFVIDDVDREALHSKGSQTKQYAGPLPKRKSVTADNPTNVAKVILQVLTESPQARPLVLAALQQLQEDQDKG